MASTQGDFMFRSPRTLVSMLAAGLLVLGACGGDDGDSSSEGSSEESSGESSGGGAAAATLADVVAAVEGTGYDCNPDSFVMTGAVRESCLTTSSIGLSAYAWDDAEAFASQVGSEVRCSLDSSLGEIRSLQGDTWAVSAVPLSGSPTADNIDAIDSALEAVQATLGGDIVSTPCS